MFSETETSLLNSLLRLYLEDGENAYFSKLDEVSALYKCPVNCTMNGEFMHVYLDIGRCMYDYSVNIAFIEKKGERITIPL